MIKCNCAEWQSNNMSHTRSNVEKMVVQGKNFDMIFCFRNAQTGEEVVVHTNKIEGTWKHAKQHFRVRIACEFEMQNCHINLHE